MPEYISSRQNEKIKRLRALLRDAKFRRTEGEYACEGLKLFGEARANSAEITSVFLTEEAAKTADIGDIPAFILPGELIDYVSEQKSPQGIVFTCRMGERFTPERLKGRYILLDSVSDPGNVGAIMRTAAALGMDGLLLCGSCADIYNPKTVRGSMGALFRLPVFEIGYGEFASLIGASGIPLFRAHAREGAVPLAGIDLKNALVALGSEAAGLSEQILAMEAGDIIIPMKEGAESLGVAAAASIVMWEMVRG